MNKLQQAEFEILQDFDQFCKEHDIKYQLYAGTLLGAIRHQGFIPWDDDIDVCMTRSEYEKFVSKYDNNKQKNKLYHEFNTKNYYLAHAKLRNDSLNIEENIPKSQTSRFGPWIDIFVFDNIPTNYQEHFNEVNKVNNILRMTLFIIYKKDKTIKNRIKKAISITNDKLVRLYFFIPRLIKKRHQLITKYNTQQTEYLAIPGFYKFFDEYKNSLMHRDSFTKFTTALFEGQYFPIPENYDECLTRLYGDYMTIPNQEERVTHSFK